jgi:pyruvate/2-oxoglutarate/acetoin dehydrogenase E1 component
MKYLEYINKIIKEKVRKNENCVLFGQNINGGSCLGGLTRNIELSGNSKIFNSSNAENSLVGFGFGVMMNGSSAVFLMKQLDFLLLGIDHIVNTFNIIRSIKDKYPQGSFTIVATIVDSGYDGPQSSFNNFYDLCAIARIDGFNINNKTDADHLFAKEFLQPGFRIICLSQKLSKENLDEVAYPINIISNGNIFQYSIGMDVTIVTLNFSCVHGLNLTKLLKDKGINASHFNINNITNNEWDSVIIDIYRTKRIVLIDDSKSFQTSGDQLLSKICGMEINKKIIIKRELRENWLYPVSDLFEIDYMSIVNDLNNV